MTRLPSTIFAFNRGIVSRLGLARVDVPRMRIAAAVQRNFMPRVLGAMMLRPGMAYLTGTHDNAFARTIPYVRSATVQARLELTDEVMRILIDDAPISRPAVTAAVSNGTFTSNATGWTDADEAGATSAWIAAGYLSLQGNGTNFAIRRQQVTVNEADVEHALRIVIARGPVMLRVGSTSGGEEYIGETALGTGVHSLAFTPSAGSFYIQFSTSLAYPVYVDSVEVEGSGIVTLPTPWTEDDLPNIRHTTSADVIYVADGAHQQRKIERRGARSWSVVLYAPETGPFRIQNTSNTTITSANLSGSTTLTASKGIFRSTHVGALFRQASQGQNVSASVAAENTFTDPIRVAGIGEQRRFGIIIQGTFTATVTVQYSVGEPGSWVDLATTYTAPTLTSYVDGQDNQIIYYRIGVKTGDFSAGPVACSLIYSSGSITGVARITDYSSPTSVSAVVLRDFGATTASPDWWEGEWSDYRGWPTAIALHEGRLWHAGRDKIWGSISDAYEDFDDEFEGDAGPISRSLGEGPVDSIHWLLPLGRLLLGTALNSARVPAAKIDGNNVMAARSSSFDEPLTPTNFTLKNSAVRGIFVDRSEQRLYELAYSIESNDYAQEDLTVLVPDLNAVGIAGVAVQMKPDVRIHCWRTDGTVGCLVFDRAENVLCWVEITTYGSVEDISVLPGAVEDQVYYIVSATIDGGTVRHHLKWALESQCDGQPGARLSDAHVVYNGGATTTISGLDHLEGEDVVVWGWNTATPFTDGAGNAVGRDLGTFTVAGGAISGLAAAVTDACVGLPYVAEFQSAKQAISEAGGFPLNQTRKITRLGLVLLDTHYQGVRYGQSLDNTKMHDLSKAERGVATNANKVWGELDTSLFAFGGSWNTDARICLRAASPRPCTVLAASIEVEGG